MHYEIALRAADLTLIGIWIAPLYYISRTFLFYVQRTPALSALKGKLMPVVKRSRISHPYIGASLLLFFPYHAYVMFTSYGINPKTLLGIFTLASVSLTIFSGFVLWRNRANIGIRSIHRRSMFILLVIATWHRIF